MHHLQMLMESSHRTTAGIYYQVQVRHYLRQFVRRLVCFSLYLRKEVCFQIVSMPSIQEQEHHKRWPHICLDFEQQGTLKDFNAIFCTSRKL